MLTRMVLFALFLSVWTSLPAAAQSPVPEYPHPLTISYQHAVGAYGPVHVGRDSVINGTIGSNSEVEIGRNVRCKGVASGKSVTVGEGSTVETYVAAYKTDVVLGYRTKVSGDVLAARNVRLGEASLVEGNVFALTGNIDLLRDSLVGGSTFANGDTILRTNTRVVGDLYSNRDIRLGEVAAVEGQIVYGRSVTRHPTASFVSAVQGITPLPPANWGIWVEDFFHYPIGTQDIEVPPGQVFYLPAGSYRNLRVRKGATIIMNRVNAQGEGQTIYYFRNGRIETKAKVKVVEDPPGLFPDWFIPGLNVAFDAYADTPRNWKDESFLTIESGVTLETYDAPSLRNRLYFAATGDLRLGSGLRWKGQLGAYWGNLTIGDYTRLDGGILLIRGVTRLGRGVVINHYPYLEY